jgi:hypothetical protein
MTKRNSETHRAKMLAKKTARPNIVCGFTPIDGKLTGILVAQAASRGISPRPSAAMRRYDMARVSVPASVNHRTGKPHEHRREIARRLAA